MRGTVEQDRIPRHRHDLQGAIADQGWLAIRTVERISSCDSVIISCE